jgi:hypothetical protein
MSFFDQAFDDMTWQEICYRLPSDLAINALKRRVTNLDTLKMFFDNAGNQPASVKQLKDHVNTILTGSTLDDIFNMFDSTYHPTLFNWMSPENVNRFRSYDPNKLGLKFLFNITDSKDQAALESIMDKILAEQDFNQAQLRSVLRKADDKCLAPLLDKIIKDTRPEVRANILCIPGLTNKEMVSDLYKTIGLKALAKCANFQPISTINVMSMNVFSSLKPMERLIALEKYLSYFPVFQKVKVFDPAPSDEEFQMILFAGCIEHNEKVTKLLEQYKQITEMDPPAEEKDDQP